MAMHGVKTMFSKMFQAEGSVKNVVNLIVGAPGPDILKTSRDILLKAATTAMAKEEPGDMFQYGPPAGDPHFLNQLADMLEKEYGKKKNIANMLSTSGATAGLNLIASTLMTRDCVVFLEDPTYFIAINMLRDDMGIPVVSVARDEDGISLDKLEAAVEAEKKKRSSLGGENKFWGMIYLVPTYHNPTGRNMTPDRCQRVIEVARRHGLLVVCDDVYNLLYYSGDGPRTRMQDYERTYPCETTAEEAYESGVVLSNNTFAKVLGPGLRVGWIEGPTKLIDAIGTSNTIRSSGAPNHFTSVVLGYALEAGGQQDMLKTLRRVNGERMRAACEELTKNLPDGSTFDAPEGGYFIWVRFPETLDTATIIPQLKAKHGVVVPPGKAFSGNGNFSNCTRICIAFHTEEDIRRGVKALCQVATEKLAA